MWADPDYKVRLGMATAHPDGNWEALACDPDAGIRGFAARSAPSLSEETLSRLSNDPVLSVRKRTLGRKDLPEAVTLRNLLSNAKMRQKQAASALKGASSHEKLELASRAAEISPKAAKKALARLAQHAAA